MRNSKRSPFQMIGNVHFAGLTRRHVRIKISALQARHRKVTTALSCKAHTHRIRCEVGCRSGQGPESTSSRASEQISRATLLVIVQALQLPTHPTAAFPPPPAPHKPCPRPCRTGTGYKRGSDMAGSTATPAIAARTKAEHNLDHDGSPENIHVRSAIGGAGYA